MSKFFPISTNFGGIFRFEQAIWSRIGNLGLVRRYKTELMFKKVVKMIICLSFLPVNEVTIGYKFIKQFIIDLNIYGLEEFLSYFEKNYVGSYNDKTGESIKLSYDISFWNVYQRVLLGPPRTSNNAEPWNRTLNLRTVVYKPNIAQYIADLFRQEELDTYNIKRAKIGIFQNSKNYSREERIKICV
ncbi:hypothetical protein H312_00682 [Anncaliia algerae PRA339]|uniref:Uncharacterized protein n=1 Tax=Anncaliia algerae PRA339 TaxID=1288291 RepID=A0A059F4M5_9MICR|nr:hypothetical protein H312_00682 [Anncaliia algerae PRA339]